MSESPVIDVHDKLRLLGTAHIATASVEAVRHHIATYQPDIVAVELCKSRHDALVSDLPAPTVGFSAAGGAIAGNVVRSLSGGKVVIYGAKSADPIVVPAESKVSVEGFWLDE